MPSRILFYPKIIKERKEQRDAFVEAFCWQVADGAFFLRRFAWTEQINPYFCRQKPRPMNERGVMVVMETL